MENKTIIAHDNIGFYMNYLKMNGYRYILKAQDKFLSGWGMTGGKKHIHLIACKTQDERETIYQDLLNDKTFNYINWYNIHEDNKILNTIRNKTYTIRNDWTRCF